MFVFNGKHVVANISYSKQDLYESVIIRIYIYMSFIVP